MTKILLYLVVVYADGTFANAPVGRLAAPLPCVLFGVVPDVLVVPQAYYVGIERSGCVGRRRDGFFCVDCLSDAEFPSKSWIRRLFMRFVEKVSKNVFLMR